MDKPNIILLKEILTSLKREVGLRQSVYPKLVASGKMPNKKAKREIELMQYVLDYFQSIYDEYIPPIEQQKLF